MIRRADEVFVNEPVPTGGVTPPPGIKNAGMAVIAGSIGANLDPLAAPRQCPLGNWSSSTAEPSSLRSATSRSPRPSTYAIALRATFRFGQELMRPDRTALLTVGGEE
ncbi:hypothetical protein [Xylanimonas sp. McL0601]|uniref:hypothetical protein n=1 Tax=Xylanimonas sp. McL0601 TaxID=3414739 RepID=UPI003CEBC589